MPAFRAPGSAGAAAAGSWAVEQMTRAGGGDLARRMSGTRGRCAPRSLRRTGRAAGSPGTEVDGAHRSRLGPRCEIGMARCFLQVELAGPPGVPLVPSAPGVDGVLVRPQVALTSTFCFLHERKTRKRQKGIPGSSAMA